MKRIGAALCILLPICQSSSARSDQTAEGYFTAQVAMAAHEFAEEHAGTSPSSWADLQPYFNNKPIDELFPDILPTKRYTFYSKPLRLTYRFEGEVMLITSKPFREITYGSYGHHARLTEPGRYIVYRNIDKAFLRTWVTEDRVQIIFQGSGSALPEPDNEPERQHEIDFRRRKSAPWIVLAVVVLFCTLILWLINRK